MTADDTRTLVEMMRLSHESQESDPDPLAFVVSRIEEAATERRDEVDVHLGDGGARAVVKSLRSRGYEVRSRRELGGVTLRVSW